MKQDPFRVICINDADRPNEIPTSKWLKKNTPYTVIEVIKLKMQNGLLAFKLKELNIDDCFPYQYFAASRFGIPVDSEILKVKEVEVEVKKDIKEHQLELT